MSRHRILKAPEYESEITEAAAILDRFLRAPDAPAKIAWLLDHQYSPAGLSFSALKGTDAAKARVLVQGAARAQCVALPRLPVILTSGHPVSDWTGRDSTDIESLGSDSVALLSKPFHAQELSNAVRVLLAPQALEDESSLMMLMRHALKQYNLIEATTAEQALCRFREHDRQPDLLVADVTLAARSGVQVALLLRVAIPRLPVILTSGHPVSDWTARDSTDIESLGSDSLRFRLRLKSGVRVYGRRTSV